MHPILLLITSELSTLWYTCTHAKYVKAFTCIVLFLCVSYTSLACHHGVMALGMPHPPLLTLLLKGVASNPLHLIRDRMGRITWESHDLDSASQPLDLNNVDHIGLGRPPPSLGIKNQSRVAKPFHFEEWIYVKESGFWIQSQLWGNRNQLSI